MTRDDIVAALGRAQSELDAALLRALADSLREAETHYRSRSGYLYTEQRTSISLQPRAPVWVIPEPKVQP